MLTITVGTLLTRICHLLIAITISEWKSFSGAISDFWNFEILRPFLKAFQHSNTWRLSEACRSNMILATQRKMETHFCVAVFFSKLQSDFVLVNNLSDKSCKILGSFLQYNAFFFKKIVRILQKVEVMQGLGRFWQQISDWSHFPAKIVCWADQNFPASFLPETCKIFLYLRDNSVVRFLHLLSDASHSCKILPRYLWRKIYGKFSIFNTKYSSKHLIMPLLTSSGNFSYLLAAVSSGNKLIAIIPRVALVIFH